MIWVIESRYMEGEWERFGTIYRKQVDADRKVTSMINVTHCTIKYLEAKLASTPATPEKE